MGHRVRHGVRKAIVKLVVLSLLLSGAQLFAQDILQFSAPGNRLNQTSYLVLKEAYAQLNLEFESTQYPPKRALGLVRAGLTDGELYRTKIVGDLHPEIIRVPVVIDRLEIFAYSSQIRFQVDGFDSLKGVRIGIREGVIFLQQATQGLDVHQISTLRDMVFMVAAGNLDVILMERYAAYDILRQHPGVNIQPLEKALVTEDLYHYLHIKHESLVPKITEVLQEMQRSGRIEAIRQQVISEMTAEFSENE